MKIAIIGTGISSLGAAYLLNPSHELTVYEKNDYVGGHSRTIDVEIGNQKIAVDTGFIVFNKMNYKNLVSLFERLDVAYKKSNMSFGVSIDDGWLEYGSSDMFAQRRNFFRLAYYGMIKDILRFNKKARHHLKQDLTLTLEEFLNHLKMGDWFKRYHLLAMGAAIWSSSVDRMLQFPAKNFIQFYDNHGLLDIMNRPQWYTTDGGSREYVKKLIAGFEDKIKLNCGVAKIIPKDNKVLIIDRNGGEQIFDHVILGCHADEALSMIENPSDNHKSILGAFSYQNNRVVIHRDESFMPKNKKCWASWVYLSEQKHDKNSKISLSYWMNNLQELNCDSPIILTLNPGRMPQKDLIFDIHAFSHPIFDEKAIMAQKKISHIQGIDGIWFCGAYQHYGFHESGLLSAMNVAKAFGVEIPWQ